MTRPSSTLFGAMGSPRSLEAWATARLESMGVDGVFAPYVIGMLDDANAPDDDADDEVMFSVHQVLMGWLSPEDEETAMEFVEDLLKFYRNPSLVPADKPTGGDALDARGFADVTVDAELKASAPLFVPHYEETLSGPLSSGASTDGVGEYDQADDNDVPAVDVMQDEETFFWSVAFDLVGHLQLKFPEVDPTRMCDLLKAVELDVDTAHAVLKATLEKETTGITQVCRHYLAGDCRRADCMFVHDTHTVTCRFWLRGMCMQTDSCVFAHDFAEFYALDHARAQRRECDSEDEGDDGIVLNFDAEEMFPSLGAATASSSSSSKKASTSPSPSTASTTSSGGSTGSWGSHKSDPVGNLSLNFARAVSVQPSQDDSGGYGYHSPAPAPRRAPVATRRPLYHKTAETVSGSRWLTTGSAVTAQYKQLREEAYELACARNKCFMQATRAYQSGNKSLARSLSAQGHEYNVRMKRCHYNAALQIFESRNPKSQIYHDRVMDLHGLHVAEAVEFLSAMLATLADDGIDSIHIVTGSGHHSRGATGNARLLPAVERFLATEGYQFSPVADRRGYVGMLMVDLRW